MSVGDIGSIMSAGVAFIALIVSLISMHKSNKFGATADNLNKILIEREQENNILSKKADICANLIKIGKNSDRLKVFNRGKGVARNVRLIDLDGVNSVLDDSDIQAKFPIPILEQHQSVEICAAIYFGASPRTHIKLQWDDETGLNHEKELTPTL